MPTHTGAGVDLGLLEVFGLGTMTGKKILVVRAECWVSGMLPVAVDQNSGVLLARSYRGRVNAKAAQSILQAVLHERQLCSWVQALSLFRGAKRS